MVCVGADTGVQTVVGVLSLRISCFQEERIVVIQKGMSWLYYAWKLLIETHLSSLRRPMVTSHY